MTKLAPLGTQVAQLWRAIDHGGRELKLEFERKFGFKIEFELGWLAGWLAA